MASAFTKQEQTIIKKALKDAAAEFAATIGMKKTTIDQLADEAGISKGAFYRFYDSKESLFFEVLEDEHTELYNAALQVLTTQTDLPAPKRAAKAILKIFTIMEKRSLMDFFSNDMPSILRKVPPEILQEHYHSDDVHIKDIITQSGLKLTVSSEVASAAIRGLMLTLLYRKDIGEHYHSVLTILVEGACEKMVKSDLS